MNSILNFSSRSFWNIFELFYKEVTKTDVTSEMESFNAINESFILKNKLLEVVLKDKFGFKVLVMSDWLAV